ncbi:MAG: PH domain-containing protein [Asgard group archaeon]|nr:PH domain-containing protein [Asgard group archaeon]
MERKELIFKPHRSFHIKRNIVAFFMTGIIFGGTILVAYIDDDFEMNEIFWYFSAAVFPTVLICWIIFNFLYIRRIIYEIGDNEITIRRGILQKKVKVVPFQAITNISIFRDPIDRIFRLGSIRVQTAGYSGEKSPEMRIQGIVNFVEIYDKIMYSMKRIARISTLEEMDKISDDDKFMSPIDIRRAILQEFIEIKELLRKRRELM